MTIVRREAYGDNGHPWNAVPRPGGRREQGRAERGLTRLSVAMIVGPR
jgi:hypothetical protein